MILMLILLLLLTVKESFKVKQMPSIIFTHVWLQTDWFHCLYQTSLVIHLQLFVFKEKRPVRG